LSTEEYHDMTGSTIGKMSYQGQGKCPMWKFKRLEVTLKYNENSTFNIIGNIKKGYALWPGGQHFTYRLAQLIYLVWLYQDPCKPVLPVIRHHLII